MDLDGGEKKTSWAGADAEIDKHRPQSILNNLTWGPIHDLTDVAKFDLLLNSFCPTGPGGGVDPTCGKGEGNDSSALSKTEDIVKLMADQYEAKHGWTVDKTREGFIKNWTKNLKGTEVLPEVAKRLSDEIDNAKRELDLPNVPVIIREHADYDAGKGDAFGRWNNGHIIIYPHAANVPAGGISSLGKERTASPTTAYKNPVAGILAHETGHSLHDADPSMLDRAKSLLSDDKSRSEVARLLGRYAATAPEEVVAEAYTMRKHPDYGKLPSDFKGMVEHVLG